MPEGTNKEIRIFAMSMLDALRIAEKTKTPLYCGKSGEATLRRIKTVEDIHNLIGGK